MSIPAKISLATVNDEIAACREDAEAYDWVISDPDPGTQRFGVTMKAPKDKEFYEMIIQFDNYPEQPLLIDFKDPRTAAMGTTHAYPKNSGDSFFHPKGLICHPCSRKSYAGYSGIHGGWSLTGWKALAESLTTIGAILNAIYSRVSNKHYAGRMAL